MLRFHGGGFIDMSQGLRFPGPLVSDFGGLKFWSPFLQQFNKRLALPCCKVGQVGATMTVVKLCRVSGPRDYFQDPAEH